MRYDGPMPVSQALGTLLALPLCLLAAIAPATASAHGGLTLAEGQSHGVTVIVQGSDATSASGEAEVDLATTLAGPGTGPSAKVVYYVRPAGRERSFRVDPDRDESGVRHAEISTAGRGNWRRWDVSAIVTLAGGKRLRVASTETNPPGPAPTKRPRATSPDGQSSAATDPAREDHRAAVDGEAAVEDISGEAQAAPAWDLPSLVGVGIAALAGLAIVRRRRQD